MELALNLAWVLLAVLTLGMWLRSAPSAGAERRMQFVALALLLLILFPVISVTDDLQVNLSPAEADCCLRRDHVVSNPDSLIPALAVLPQPSFAGLSFGTPRFAAHCNLPAPPLNPPSLATVQKRPPPSA